MTALSMEGQISGTLQYMAPEQLEGKPADARSDIFAFGLVLYEMISGRRPFTGDSAASTIASIMKEQPRPLNELQPPAPQGAGLDRPNLSREGSGQALAIGADAVEKELTHAYGASNSGSAYRLCLTCCCTNALPLLRRSHGQVPKVFSSRRHIRLYVL